MPSLGVYENLAASLYRRLNAEHAKNDGKRLELTLHPTTVSKQAAPLSKLRAIIMTTHSTIRYFRKTALCTVFALTAGVTTSASAEQTQPPVPILAYTVNYNPAVKAVYMQNVHNPGGWACVQVTAARSTGGFKEAPALLYGFTYSMRGMSNSDCRSSSALPNVYLKEYTATYANQIFFNITKNSIYVTD